MDKRYWIHRISYKMDVSYPLLEKGYLSIGFSDFATAEFLHECDGNWDYFQECFKSQWGFLPRNRHTLWRFICEMKKGDWIIVPSWGNFHIFEIIDDKICLPSDLDIEGLKSWNDTKVKLSNGYLYYQNEKDNFIDLGFFRKVKPIAENIERNKYADSKLTARLKVRQTNIEVSDLSDSIKNSLNYYKQKKPINLQSLIIESSLKNAIKLIKENLNPNKFEKLIEQYFKNIGASSTIIPSKNESDKAGDADIIATFEKLKTIYYIQAKFHTGETGSYALEQVNEYVQLKNESLDDGYTKIPWVITSAKSFTKDSIEKAKELNIQLFNIDEFAVLILESGICNYDSL